MQVTRIEELSKSRSKIYLEQEFAFALYKGELRRYHVKEGEELPRGDYEAIMNEVLPKRARLRAMNLLMHRAYTTSQLRAKLRQGLYPEPVVEAALEYVASFHYTDDLRYALDYISGCADSRSRRRIEQDLLGKGIPGDILESAWRKWEEQGGGQDEERMIRELLRKRGFAPDTADFKEVGRQFAFLTRKGFSGESIRKVLHGFAEDEFDG